MRNFGFFIAYRARKHFKKALRLRVSRRSVDLGVNLGGCSPNRCPVVMQFIRHITCELTDGAEHLSKCRERVDLPFTPMVCVMPSGMTHTITTVVGSVIQSGLWHVGAPELPASSNKVTLDESVMGETRYD